MPKTTGFRMPAEWAPHSRCWMAWPCRDETFADMAAARDAFADVARAIARFEPVTMVARSQDVAEASLRLGGDVDVLPMDLDDSWMRDIGPTFVIDDAGTVAGVDWRFNAWGGNYPEHRNDEAVAERILEHLGLRRFVLDIVLEGGSIHCDGEGTLLVTEQCLLNPNRNPQLTKAEIEERLKLALGAETLIWLGQGLVDDETDGHIDNLACFVKPGVVAALVAEDPSDGNYEALRDNLKRLRLATDAGGRKLEIVEINQPEARVENGVRLALSYINFYIANRAIVMPSFEDTHDGLAYRKLKAAFPKREIIQIPVLDIVRGGGGIHCITQQQPAGFA